MTLVGLKHGLEMDHVDHTIYYAIAKAAPIMSQFGEFVVTSLRDGTHMDTSLHYKGLAMDIRTRHMTDEQITGAVADLRAALGKDYDVVREHDHIHIEYDSKEIQS